MEGPRAARKEELQDLIDLINYVFRVSASKEPDMHICFPLFISENNLDNLLVYADRKTGKPISHLGLWINDFSYFGESLKIGYIGSVCTHPDYRGQGLASKLLDVAFQQLEQNGVDLLLVSGSRSLYVRAGCRVVGVVNWYTIPKKEQDVWFDVTVDPPVEPLNELWMKEPLRTKRGLKNFEALVEAGALPRCMGSKSKVYLASIGGVPLAYVQAVHNKDGSVYIYEWAGDRSVIVDLVRFMANSTENDTSWPVPSWETALLEFLSKMEAPVTKTGALSGTYKIIRFASFIEKVGRYLAEAFGGSPLTGFDQDGMQVLVYEDEKLALPPDEMLNLLFSGKLPDAVPPKMQALFEKALPLPLPWPIGFDFI